MRLPFEVTLGQVTILGFVFAVAGFASKRAVDWWRDRKVRRKERVKDWHKEMRQAFSEIRSVGTRLKANRRGNFEVDILGELIAPTKRLDADTDVEVGDVTEIIGEVSQPDEIDISESEAKQILDDFEKEANRRMDNTEDMTVDEFMELPWEEVDRLISTEARQKLIQSSVEQYYEKALLEKPQEAKRAINKSEKQLFR